MAADVSGIAVNVANIESATSCVSTAEFGECVLQDCNESRRDLDYSRCREARTFSCDDLGECTSPPANEETTSAIAGNKLVVQAKGNKLFIKAEGTLTPDVARPINGENLADVKVVLCSDNRALVNASLTTAHLQAKRNAQDRTQDGPVGGLIAEAGKNVLKAHWPNANANKQLLKMKAKILPAAAPVSLLPENATGLRVDFGGRTVCMEFPFVDIKGKKSTSASSAVVVDCSDATLHCPTEIIEP